jgi:hypothetical protein
MHTSNVLLREAHTDTRSITPMRAALSTSAVNALAVGVGDRLPVLAHNLYQVLILLAPAATRVQLPVFAA